MKTDLFQSCGHYWVFQICWHNECSTFTASSFRTWNSSTGIPSPALALFIVMFSKAHLTSHSRMSGSLWVIICHHGLLGHEDLFLYSSSVHCFYLFLISSASVRSIWFMFFIVPIFAWNIPLVSLIFLKISLVLPILLFYSIFCIDYWGRLSYLSLLFFGTLHSDGYYLSFSLLSLDSLLSSVICNTSSENHFAFLHLLFFGMVLITASCPMSQTSIHSSSGTLSIRSNHLSLFVTSTV